MRLVPDLLEKSEAFCRCRRFEGLSVRPLFASSMCYNRRSLVFYDVIILLLSVMMNNCGFSRWSYHVFHLPYVAAMSVNFTIPILFLMLLE
jgi:hypothetical protein